MSIFYFLNLDYYCAKYLWQAISQRCVSEFKQKNTPVKGRGQPTKQELHYGIILIVICFSVKIIHFDIQHQKILVFSISFKLFCYEKNCRP